MNDRDNHPPKAIPTWEGFIELDGVKYWGRIWPTKRDDRVELELEYVAQCSPLAGMQRENAR